MPYKIHLEQKDIATGKLLPEGDPLMVVETLDEAKKELGDLVRQGLRDVYAVGHERPHVVGSGGLPNWGHRRIFPKLYAKDLRLAQPSARERQADQRP